MKILAGVTASLALLALFLGWQLKSAWSDADLSNQRASQALQAVDEQRRQADLLLGRLDTLDEALRGLALGDLRASQQLDLTLAEIRGISKTEGDSDESITCLDVPVPRGLDDSLR